MTDNFDDELAGIFDDLSPEDFSPNRGRVAFDKFVDRHVQIVRMAYLASEGNINPVAILATDTEEHEFTPTQEETLGEYVARLHDEAEGVGAKWLFISRKTLVGSLSIPASEMFDLSDPEQVQAAIEKGLMSEGVFYYAERTEGAERQRRHGMMRADGNRLAMQVEGDSEHQSVDFFSSILGTT